jgi:hypothetical protein
MAVMLRTLGVPARVAVGFTTGVSVDVGTYRVSTDNAHAWVEVYFPGYGWLPFEPTPSRSNLAAASYLQPQLAAPCTGRNCDTGPQGRDRGARGAGGTTDPGRAARERADRTSLDPAPLPATVPAPSWRRHVLPALGLLLAAAALAALAVPPAKAIARRRRIARAKDPRSLVLATYDVFAARAADLGVGRREHETFEEFSRRVQRSSIPVAGPRPAEALEAGNGAVVVLTSLAERAAYAPGAIAADDARTARENARSALRLLRRTRGRLRQLPHVWRRGL